MSGSAKQDLGLRALRALARALPLMKGMRLLGCALLALLFACGGYTEDRFVRVSSYLVPCEGVGPQLCFELEDLQDSSRTLLYQRIEGFDYQWGVDYVLRISIEDSLEPVAADGSTVTYRMVELIQQVQSAPDFSIDVSPRFLSPLEGGHYGLLGAREIDCFEPEVCEALQLKLQTLEQNSSFSLELSHPIDSDDPLIARAVR